MNTISFVNNRRHFIKGFTLIELIIVIIIIGVLTSLALPRLINFLRLAEVPEAIAGIDVIRAAAERCALYNNGDFSKCRSMQDLDIEDPANTPGSRFGYSYIGMEFSVFGNIDIWAQRKGSDNPAADRIYCHYLIQVEDEIPLPGGALFGCRGSGIYEGFNNQKVITF